MTEDAAVKEIHRIAREFINLGLVGYGKVINREALEEAFKTKWYASPDKNKSAEFWAFRGPYMELRAHFMEIGHGVTERGVDAGAIRFYAEHEIPRYIKKRRTRRHVDMMRDVRALERLPLHVLSDRERKLADQQRERLFREQVAMRDLERNLEQVKS